jgi:hypothetical protein
MYVPSNAGHYIENTGDTDELLCRGSGLSPISGKTHIRTEVFL